mgnify:CR=1 FL=1
MECGPPKCDIILRVAVKYHTLRWTVHMNYSVTGRYCQNALNYFWHLGYLIEY